MSNLFGDNPPNYITAVDGSFHPTLAEDSRDTASRRERCGPVCTAVAILFGVLGILLFSAAMAFIIYIWFGEHPLWVW